MGQHTRHRMSTKCHKYTTSSFSSHSPFHSQSMSDKSLGGDRQPFSSKVHGPPPAWPPVKIKIPRTFFHFKKQFVTVVSAFSKTMPFNSFSRRDSWPPTRIRVASHTDEITDDDLDSNPFSYFLTRPEDDAEGEMQNVDLSAGIEQSTEGSSSSSKQPIIRSVSPSAIQRKRLDEYAVYDDDDDDEDYIRDLKTGFAVPMSLKEYLSANDVKKINHPGRKRDREPEHKTEPAIRGRGILKSPYGRGRSRTRSLSGGAMRPHAWREPSPDVWSIPEAIEEDDGYVERETTPALMEDVGDKENGPISPMTPILKGKKRVHWAE